MTALYIILGIIAFEFIFGLIFTLCHMNWYKFEDFYLTCKKIFGKIGCWVSTGK